MFKCTKCGHEQQKGDKCEQCGSPVKEMSAGGSGGKSNKGGGQNAGQQGGAGQKGGEGSSEGGAGGGAGGMNEQK